MSYVALTFWLLVMVLLAWGVHRLCSELVRPKILNAILLPGTFVAQVGHILGLLVTGATVTNTTLYRLEESGEPETTPHPKPRIPVVGPVIIGLLPLLACATVIYLAAGFLGRPVLAKMNAEVIGPTLPMTLSGFWQMLRDQITLVESIVTAITTAGFVSWKTGLFLYLLVCLAIRIAPFRGHLRGSLAAIVILGIAAAALSSLFGVADPRIQNGWAVLNLTVATLLLLLMLTLLVRGAVGLARVLREPV